MGFIVGIFATLLAAVVGLAAAYFGGVVDDILSVVNGRVPPHPEPPAARHPRGLPAAGPSNGDVRAGGDGMGRSGTRATKSGALYPCQGFRSGLPRLGRAPHAHHVPRDSPQHGLNRDGNFPFRGHRCHRRPGGPRVPRTRRSLNDQLGHQPLLGVQRRRPHEGPMVGLHPLRPVHRARGLRTSNAQLRRRRSDRSRLRNRGKSRAGATTAATTTAPAGTSVTPAMSALPSADGKAAPAHAAGTNGEAKQ